MQDQNETKTHPFERTLGPGPYRFIGVGEVCFSETFGARYIGPECERGAGTCAHCGHAIKYVYVIETSEKRRFGVGSDCIAKVSMPVKILSQVQKIEKARQKQLRQARKVAKGEAARVELAELIQNNANELEAIDYRAAYKDVFGNQYQRQSLLNYAKFCLEKSGDGGIVLVLKRVKNAIESVSK